MARIEGKTKRYPTDLTDEEWARIGPLLPGRHCTGRPRATDLREVLNAIRYLVRTGCGWSRRETAPRRRTTARMAAMGRSQSHGRST
jgi:transposase